MKVPRTTGTVAGYGNRPTKRKKREAEERDCVTLSR